MKEPQLEIESVLKQMREIIGTQAQEIAILRATIAADEIQS